MDRDVVNLLPHNVEAEKAVLGAILRDGGSMLSVADQLQPEFFFSDAHQKIYSAQAELYKKNEGIDIVTVSSALSEGASGKHNQIGPTYLIQLTEDCPVTQNIEYYAEIVRKQYYLRRVIYTCQDTIKRAQQKQDTADHFIEEVEKEFLKISSQNDRSGIVMADKVIESTIAQIEKNIMRDGTMTGVPTGFAELDELTGGWQSSDLMIIAARPGMGKTAFALNCAANAMQHDRKVVIFTLEMSKEQLMSRVLSSEARVDSARLRRGDLTEDETDRLMEGARKVYSYYQNLGIDETPSISVMELRSRCRRFQKEKGLDMVIVDYLQLMGAGGASRGQQSREREISEISMGLKGLAKELNIPVIALSQLNRGPDARPDKRPKMSDLRESGSIEQDADMVFFIYRDEVYNPSSERTGIAELIIGKNRHGATKTIDLAFQPNFVSFQNLMRQ